MFKKIFLALTKKERLSFWISLGVFSVSLIVLAAITINRTTKLIPARGGSFTEGVVGQPTFINPVLAKTDTDKSMVRLLFADLPSLAEKIESDETGKIWKVRLKENLHWTDGEKLTSDDIVFTVNKIQDPETQSPLYQSWQGVAANRLSELEVQFSLVAPYAFFNENIDSLYPIPKHIFFDIPSPNWKLSDYNLNPIGSGPFKFVNKDRNSNGFINSYHLIDNPDFAATSPLIQNYNVDFFTKPEELLRTFNNTSIDGFSTFDPEIERSVNRPFQVFSFPLPNYYAVFINQSQNMALKENSVREALSLAVDREGIINDIFNKEATPLLAPNLIAQNDGSKPQIEKAKEILEEAGWKIGENNIREKAVKKDKITLEFNLTVPQVPFLLQTAKELEKNWAEIGAKVNIDQVSSDDIVNDAIKNRDYQTLIFGNFLNPPQDLYSFWHSDERFFPGLNLSMYSNNEADQLIDTIRRDLDPSDRSLKMDLLNQTIDQDHPAIFLYSPNYLIIADKDLRGVSTGLISDPADRYAKINEWHIKTARALK